MSVNVVYQFNEKYAPYAAVSITSLLYNNCGISIIILGEGLTAESMTKLADLCKRYGAEITFRDTQGLIDKMKALNMPTYRGSYAANMRLFLPEIIGEDIDRILYLDADTVIDGNIQEMYDTDMGANAIGMCYDSVGQSHKKDIGLTDSDGYFNSGVVLFNMDKWREYSLTEKIVEHVKNVRNQYAAPDQDLLNFVCKNMIYRLPVTCNFQPAHGVFTVKQYMCNYRPEVYYGESELIKKPIIYHCFRFLGEFPWDKGNLHPFTPVFDKYLSMSTFSDYIKKPTEQVLAIRIEKILYRILPHGVFLPIFVMCHRMFIKKADKDSANNEINKVM